MKKTLFLCVVSAVFGAVLAFVLRDPPDPHEESLAQETGQPWMPSASSSNLQPAAPPPAPAPSSSPPASGTRMFSEDGLTPEGHINATVYERGNRSVVNITTKSVQPNRLFMFEAPSTGEGSGTVIDREGHVLTNYHVIDGARDIRVTLFTGKTYEAKPIGHDLVTDVAVVKIDAPAKDLYPVAFGDSTRLRVGQRVFAIGNPFGLERTLSTGIVSSLNRAIPSRQSRRMIKSIIQIDAAINPGNSGGPLLDAHCRMIGMNTAIASKTGESAGVGFAIPVNTIARIVPQLLQSGRVIRPYIGIAQVYQTDHGLLVASLIPGGPAEKAGLRGFQLVTRRKTVGLATYEYTTIDRARADLILGIDGKRIHTVDDLLSAIDNKKPGEKVTVTVFRDGQEVPLRVTLAAEE